MPQILGEGQPGEAVHLHYENSHYSPFKAVRADIEQRKRSTALSTKSSRMKIVEATPEPPAFVKVVITAKKVSNNLIT